MRKVRVRRGLWWHYWSVRQLLDFLSCPFCSGTYIGINEALSDVRPLKSGDHTNAGHLVIKTITRRVTLHFRHFLVVKNAACESTGVA